MLALVYYGPNDVRLEERDVPKVGRGDVLIRVKAVGLCASDVRTIRFGSHSVIPPRVLGHEIAGVVEEVGDEVSYVSEGDRVNVAPDLYCGRCRLCASGRENLCPNVKTLGYNLDGGYAEYVLIPEEFVRRRLVFKLPPSTSFEEAALIEPLATVVEGERKLGEHVGKDMVVVGDGPMGMLHAIVGRLMGARVIVSGMVKNRLEFARRLGFDAVNAAETDPVKEVFELTDGKGADLVVVAVSNERAIEQGISMAAKGGIVELFAGLPKGRSVTLDPNRIHYDEVFIISSFSYKYSSYRIAYRLVVSRAVDVGRLVTHRFPLRDFEKALRVATSYEGLKTVILP